MNKHLWHIICWALLLPLLSSCTHDEETPQQESKASLTLNVNVSTRAISSGNDTDGYIGTLQLWIYGGTTGNKPLLYKSYSTGEIKWNQIETPGEEETEYTAQLLEKVELDGSAGITTEPLRIYAIVNSVNATIWNNALVNNISETNLKAATFSNVTPVKDNEVLMYGEGKISSPTINAYHNVSMNIKRCVAKMDLYMTQRTKDFELELISATLSQHPDKGYLIPPASWTLMTGTGTATTIFPKEGDSPLDISAVLPVSVMPGTFSNVYEADKTTFTHIPIRNPYLLEREGQDWVTAIGSDDVYPSPDDQTNAYILTLTYNYLYKGVPTTVTKDLALSRIERNTHYRIFISVHTDTQIEVNTLATPWVEGKGSHTIDTSTGKEDGFI